MSTERGILALVDINLVVVGAASYRIGDPADLRRAVEFINDGRRTTDEVRRYTEGETIRMQRTAPPRSAGAPGDCPRCDGWHDGDDCGKSNPEHIA